MYTDSMLIAYGMLVKVGHCVIVAKNWANENPAIDQAKDNILLSVLL